MKFLSKVFDRGLYVQVINSANKMSLTEIDFC